VIPIARPLLVDAVVLSNWVSQGRGSLRGAISLRLSVRAATAPHPRKVIARES
jgi:hypothetical protein